MSRATEAPVREAYGPAAELPPAAPGAPNGRPADAWDRVLGLARALRRHFRLFLALSLPLPIAVGTMSLLSQREYVVAASFVPQEPTGAAGGLGALGSQLGLAVGRATTGPQFYADLLTTKTMLKDVVLTRYEIPGFRGTLVDYYGEAGDSLRTLLHAQKELDDALQVTTNRTTGVVRVTLHTKYPALSLAVIQRFLGLLNDFNLNRRQTSGRAEREFLERRLALARDAAARAENALAVFLSANRGDLMNAPRLDRERGRLERETIMRQSAVTTIAGQLESARTDEIRNTPLITVVERPEDTLEPMGRGTVTRTLAAGIAGGLIALVVVLWRATRPRRLARATEPQRV